MEHFEKTLKVENIYTGKIVTLNIETVLLPNENKTKREIVKHPGAVAILPITEEGEVVLVKQFRKALNSELLEIPAGKLEKDENPQECALRELQEEIGYTANRMTYIGTFYTSPGFTNEKVYIYKAEELLPSKLEKDNDEFITVIKYRKEEVLQMLEEGDIFDAKTGLAISLGLK